METVYIYVIGQECGPVKVGISTKPWSRALTIGTSSPFKVQLLYCQPFSSREEARQFERSFHDVYCDYRMAGEWFNLVADLAIEGIQTAVDIDNHFREMEALERRREMQEARGATRQ